MSDLQVAKAVLFVCSSVKVWIFTCRWENGDEASGSNNEDLSILTCCLEHLHLEIALRGWSSAFSFSNWNSWSLWEGKNLGDVPAHTQKSSFENKTIRHSCSKPSAGKKKKWQIQATINLHNIIHFYSLPAGFMPTLHMRAMRLSLGRNNFISPPWLMRRAMNLWSNKAETAFPSLTVPVTSVSLALSCFPRVFALVTLRHFIPACSFSCLGQCA